MANISVNIVGGTEQENVVAVTVGAQRWGHNGAPFGQFLAVPPGYQLLTVIKTTQPLQLSMTLEVRDGNNTLNVTVNLDNIRVVEV
jgi:hypothetical protein